MEERFDLASDLCAQSEHSTTEAQTHVPQEASGFWGSAPLADAEEGRSNLDSFLSQSSLLDKKIDDALDRVERQRSDETGRDDLDVPAFLRHGMKDFSLS
jgi:hypothetical protein